MADRSQLTRTHLNQPKPTCGELKEQTTGAMTTQVPFKCMTSFIRFSISTTKLHRSRTKEAEIRGQMAGDQKNRQLFCCPSHSELTDHQQRKLSHSTHYNNNNDTCQSGRAVGGANSDSVVRDSSKGGEIKTQKNSAGWMCPVYGCVLQVVLKHHILVPTETTWQ